MLLPKNSVPFEGLYSNSALLHNIAPGKYTVIKVEYALQLHFKIFLNKSERNRQQQKYH